MRYSLAILLLLAAPAASAETVEQALATAPPGTRIGLLVVDEDGREVVAIRAELDAGALVAPFGFNAFDGGLMAVPAERQARAGTHADIAAFV